MNGSTAERSPEELALEDAGKRIADAMTMHTLAGRAGCWAAFWLADGRPLDNTAYDLRTDAVRAARWDRDNVVYLEISPDGMQPKEAVACIKYARALHAAGFRIPAPEFDPGSMPLMAEDRVKQILHLASGGQRFPGAG